MWPKCGFPSGSLLPTYGHSVPTLLHGSSRVEVFPLLPAVAQFTLAEAEPRPALETVCGEGEPDVTRGQSLRAQGGAAAAPAAAPAAASPER